MIEAAIFDMDGLLVDSEPHWRDVEIEVFRTIGLELSEVDCKRTTGLPTSAVVQYWFERHPWQGRTLKEIEEAILATVYDRIARLAEPMPGAVETLQFFKEKGIRMAIASASPMKLIELVIDRLAIQHYFTTWHSATLEPRNKPAPDVYLGTARKLGVLPTACVGFEDSGNGLKSAHAAGMLTVAVPADYEFNDSKFEIASIKIPSLSTFDETIYQQLNKKLMLRAGF